MINKNITININDKVAEITLNRPERMNAISLELLKDLKAVLLDLNKNDTISVIILTGAGKAFPQE